MKGFRVLKSLIRPVVRSARDLIDRYKGRRSASDVFSEVYRKKIWGSNGDDFFSGFGSHAEEIVDGYVSAVVPVIKQTSNPVVVDFGCGDFNIGSKLVPHCSRYIGCDVVPELIERNKKRFQNPKLEFRCLDIARDPLPTGDIALVRQVLQHLSNRQISAFLAGLNSFSILIDTEHLPSGDFVSNIDSPHGARIRLHGAEPSGIVLTDHPFNLATKKSHVLAAAPEDGAIIKTTAYYLR